MRPNRLMALMAANKSRPRKFEIRQEADVSAIYLYDVIDQFWGVSASAFVKALNSITSPKIELHINSPGGDVFDGRAIASAIAAHPSQVTAYVDGYAASAASIVAIAAKEVVMAAGSFMMIHNAWTFTYGNAADLRTTADLLDKIDGSLVEDYVRASGASAEQVKAWMDAETWFTAQEAVDAGLANSVAEPEAEEDAAAAAANSWDLSAYRRAPTQKAPAAAADTVLDPVVPDAAAIAAAATAHHERAERLRRASFS